MTIYYVDSNAVGTNAGTSWVNAYATLTLGLAAAIVNGDVIWTAHNHAEALGADTTYTLLANISILCVNSSTNAPATTAIIGSQATNWAITIAGIRTAYFRGLDFRTGSTNVTPKSFTVNGGDGGHFEFDSCKFTQIQTQSAQTTFGCNGSGAGNNYTRLTNCTFTFAAVTQSMTLYGQIIEFFGCVWAGTSLTTAFLASGNQQGIRAYFEGCNLATLAGTLVGDRTSTGTAQFTFKSCKLNASATIKSAAGTILNKGETEVWLYNCNSGDVNYALGHYDAFGQTVVSAAIYAVDGITIDSTHFSLVITTSANCSYYTPYTAPWVTKNLTPAGAITPYFEVVRSGSATAFKDNEIWAEWLYQGTSGFPLSIIASDRVTPPTTPADQATGVLDGTGWSGESGTSWFGKLDSGAAITPLEVGTLRGRVVVGIPSDTLYWDPTIR